MSTPPTRLPDDLYEAAKSAAAVGGRSVAQQVAHWARVGRQLEASPHVSWSDIERVRAGDASYDTLGEREQALMRTEWDARIARASGTDLTGELESTGLPWVEGDDEGRLTATRPNGVPPAAE